jgi:hypothetical protein
MNYIFVLMMLLTTTMTHAGFTAPEYPLSPIPSLTPGELCSTPTEYRYPEQIPYCERDVDTAMKEQVFEDYRRAGFVLPKNHRSSYKIDHFIPLCAGGANTVDNLWPQHKNVFIITDSLEKLACDKLKTGKITQRQIIQMIKRAKMDHRQVPVVQQELSRIY